MKLKEYFNYKDYNFWYFLFIVFFIEYAIFKYNAGIALALLILFPAGTIITGWLIDLCSGKKESGNRMSTFGGVTLMWFSFVVLIALFIGGIFYIQLVLSYH